MTKKDYELIASVIKWSPLNEPQRRVVASMFAQALADDNPRFDAEKFRAAALGEVSEDEGANLYESPDALAKLYDGGF